MRRTVVATAALAVAVAGAGCGSTSSGGSKSGSAPTGGSSIYTDWPLGGKPVRGGTVNIDSGLAPSTFDPYIALNTMAITQLYDELVESVPGKEPSSEPVLQPALASSWTISPDHLTYTFHMRPGVRFTNGEPVTAEDAVFSLQQVQQQTAAFSHVYTKHWKQVAATGPMTVQLQLTKPQPELLEVLSLYQSAIVPKKVFEREGAKGFGLHPVGSGPFMIKSTTAGNTQIRMVRNPTYWRAGEPYLNELVFNLVESDNARILAVRSGAAAIAQQISYSQVAALRSTPGVKMLVGPEWGAAYNWFDRGKAPFNEANVRQALMYATPREEIVKSVYKGLGAPANSLWGQLKYWDSKVPLYPYDIAKAKELLKHSSVPNGFEMTIEVFAGETQGELLASILQGAWAQIGVHAKIETLSSASALANFFSGKASFLIFPPEEGVSLLFDPGGTSVYFENSETGFGPPVGAKMSAKFLTASTSTSEKVREKLFPEIQYEAYRQEAVFMALVNLVTLNLVGDSVRGFQVMPNSFVRMEQVWLQ